MSTANRFARVILNGFDGMFAEWENLTLGAQDRFERAEWSAVLGASSARLSIYRGKVSRTCEYLQMIAAARMQDRSLWRMAKDAYAELVRTHGNAEIAQTFFNSCYCYTFGHEKVSGLNAFALEPQLAGTGASSDVVRVHSRQAGESLRDLFESVLMAAGFNLPFENMARDLDEVVATVDQAPEIQRLVDRGGVRVEMLRSVFYRNKAAYLIGRLCADGECAPLALPVLNNEQGRLYVDAVLWSSDQLSVLFSFTRSYFMVDIPFPSQYVRFLKQLMPSKELFELYTAIGLVKHGKSEFYRAAVAHTRDSDDQYVVAPGTRGMVMYVFTLPSFNYVYKVIKDRIPPPKEVTREEVIGKYEFVKRSERAGRMADSQEFRNLAFPLQRFSPELLDELQRECGSQVVIRGRALILKHVYVERRMMPLNLYIQDVDEQQLHAVMDEYGSAIKQLAAANIFPGDMLLKNFGVTRHGRVVFYDYDEICPLVDCTFRRLPSAASNNQSWAATTWYGVGEQDVFPEEFARFMCGEPRAQAALAALHPELYEAHFWTDIQRQIRAGVVHDVFPYRRRVRFSAHRGTRSSDGRAPGTDQSTAAD